MYSVDMSSLSNEWDAAREEARFLGSSIDTKLHILNKYASTGNRYKPDNSANRSRRTAFLQDVREVEDLLRQLEEVNRKLETIVYNKASGSADEHTLRRYHDVLKDYNHEFHRVRELVEKQLEREDLLYGGSAETEPFLSSRNRSSDMLLAEHDHITNSERMVDEQINLALGVKENIHHQQRRIAGAMHQLQITLKKYPAINNIMQKIRIKRRKDTLVLAAVISTCLILLFLYSVH
uniref:Golgi SNAP receptor complex member 1 n=1 Tax=Panagrolaimus sp. JU765 TaxID=591449 RepID=A0AC34PUE5_9BILA